MTASSTLDRQDLKNIIQKQQNLNISRDECHTLNSGVLALVSEKGQLSHVNPKLL
jgi:hypothetical protein